MHASLSGPLKSYWKVRPGMAQCLSRALSSPFQTHVVSINWSRDVIKAVLSEALLGDDGWVKIGHGLVTHNIACALFLGFVLN